VLNDIDGNLTEVIVVRRAGMLAQLDEAQRKRDELLRFGLGRQLETLERALEQASFLVEDRFTVADLNVASVLALAAPSGVDFGGLPKLRAWLAGCLARPAARSAWGQVIRDARAAGFVGDLKVPQGGRPTE
jgi:glutathione S-transferase